MFLQSAYTEEMEKDTQKCNKFWCRKWIVLSFLIGFIAFGGFWGSLIWADETDIHQQHETTDIAVKDSLIAFLISGIPGGLLTASGFGIVKWSIANKWWISKRQ